MINMFKYIDGPKNSSTELPVAAVYPVVGTPFLIMISENLFTMCTFL
jgi:hypothetical protein